MTIRVDPEENEINALLSFTDFGGKQVLEIGCGNGRLTWRYAHYAGHVTAIDPFARHIARAIKSLPEDLQDRVEFHPSALEDYAAACESSSFDLVILSWSLC